jgi:hypothetical protein
MQRSQAEARDHESSMLKERKLLEMENNNLRELGEEADAQIEKLRFKERELREELAATKLQLEQTKQRLASRPADSKVSRDEVCAHQQVHYFPSFCLSGSAACLFFCIAYHRSEDGARTNSRDTGGQILPSSLVTVVTSDARSGGSYQGV